MGHDVHFLERLERVDVGQAERALALYRNPELVKALLAELTLPAGADRIAIALDATEPSPHVIVSRDGHFVTCLAAEMSLGRAFRVGRPTLDGVRARHERLHAALDAAGSGQARRVFDHLREDPEYFSREDAHLVAAIHPLVCGELAKLTAEFYRGQENLIRNLRTRQPPALRRRALNTLWKVQWAFSVVASATVGPGVPPGMVDDQERARKSLEAWLGLVGFGFLLQPTGARGLWAVTRIARHALPELKHLRAEAITGELIQVANLSLGLTALRHPKYRAEITKVLQTVPARNDPDPKRRELVAGLDRLTAEPILKMLADPEKAQAESDAFLQGWREEVCPELPDDDPGTLYFQSYLVREYRVPLWPQDCVPALPWLASADFEDLFSPQASLHSEPPTAEALEFLASVGTMVGRRNPVRAAPSVGRNEPCPCGSGKKSKRCCAA